MSIAPPYSEPVVISVGKVTLSVAREHQEAIGKGGLSAQRIDQMEADIGELEDYPTTKADETELEGLTDAKNEALDACYDWGRSLEQRLTDRFGAGSPEEEMFPSDAFAEATRSEDGMMMVMPTLLSLVDQVEESFDGEGALEEFRAEGEADLEALRNKDLAQELFKVTKRRQTRHRQILRRRIYDTVNDITRTGRRVYRHDPEKRDLFRSPWPRASASAEPAPAGSQESDASDEQDDS